MKELDREKRVRFSLEGWIFFYSNARVNILLLESMTMQTCMHDNCTFFWFHSKAFHVENPVGSDVFRGVFSNIENFVQLCNGIVSGLQGKFTSITTTHCHHHYDNDNGKEWNKASGWRHN